MKERSTKYDNVKFFLICCVVLGHLGNRYADKSYSIACAQFWVYLFHMPAFIFIAGLFSKKTVREKRWDKAVPYLFLFWGMKMIRYTVTVLLKGIESASVDFFHENGIPWFALSMFWWYIITILVRKVYPIYVLSIAFLMSVVSGYSTDVGSFLVMQRTIIFYPFFYLGYIIEPDMLLKKLVQWPFRVASIVLVLITVIFTFLKYEDIFFWRTLFRGLRAYEKIGNEMNYAWGWLWRILAYCISFALTLAIISLTPSIKTVFSAIGKRTLSIYVFHGSFISIVLAKFVWFKRWLTGSNLAIHSLIFCIIIVFTTSLPIFDWPLRKLMNVPMRAPEGRRIDADIKRDM